MGRVWDAVKGKTKAGAGAAANWAKKSPTRTSNHSVRQENVGTFATIALVFFIFDMWVFQFQRGVNFLWVTFVLYAILAVLAFILLRPEEESGGWVVGVAFLGILSIIMYFGNQMTNSISLFFGFPSLIVFVALSVMIASAINVPGVSHFFIWCMRKSLFAWALPAVISFIREDMTILTQYIYDAGVALGVALFIGIFIEGYLKHFMIYFGGWAGWAVNTMASNGSKFFSILHKIIVFAYVIMLIIPFTSTIQRNYDANQAGSDYAFEPPPSFFEMWGDTVDLGKRMWAWAKDPTQPLPGSTAAEIDTTSANIRDTVEYAQNRDLGVIITDQFPLKTPYFIGVQEDDEDRKLQKYDDSHIAWTGELRAQTFAKDMNVTLECVYDRPAKNNDKSGVEDVVVDARPSTWLVRRTGEFVDTFGFECSIPIEKMLTVNGEPATVLDLNGQFKTRATFETESWGFTELTFMDSAAHRAYRNSNINPATELEIFPTTRPMSVPGPVGIGILDRVTQPVPVDPTKPDTLFLPSFGVSLNNRWLGRGNFVTDDDTLLILNVSIPEPFELDLGIPLSSFSILGAVPSATQETRDRVAEKCIGLGNYKQILVQKDVLRPSYTNYVFIGLEIDERDRDITIRCPFRRPWTEERTEKLLGPGNSPKTFTFTAQASFKYELTSNAIVSLAVKEDSRP